METILTDSSRALDRLYSYPEEVLSGEIVTCDKVQKACRRFQRELDRSKHDDGYPWRFDERLAVRPIEFMERFLIPTKGNYDRMTLMPWQCFAEGQHVRLGLQGDRAPAIPRGADRGGQGQRQDDAARGKRYLRRFEGRRTRRGGVPAGQLEGAGRAHVHRVLQPDQGKPAPRQQVPGAPRRNPLRPDERTHRPPGERQ